MPIITDQGIFTESLCENSKKYLSRLLIGKTGIKPDLLTWDLLLTKKFRLDHFMKTGNEKFTQLKAARAEWNLALKESTLQFYIQNKLVEIETLHAQEFLKSYDPEFKKQQADAYAKQQAWVSIAIITGLTTAFAVPLALGLLGSISTLVGVIGLALGVSLTCCSIIPAFFGEALIDPEWVKQYEIEKEKCRQKLSALKATSETEVGNEAIDCRSHAIVSPQIQSMKLHKTSIPLIPAAHQNTKSKMTEIINNFSFFNKTKKSYIYLQSLNTFANNSC